ncbi:MAG TPA: hypothetical protein DFK19_17830 [Ochrobactrum sp.]|nr:hypothetical protein [Ochrobactrum sp.]
MLKRCRLSPRKRTDTSTVRKSRRRDEYGHHALYAVRLASELTDFAAICSASTCWILSRLI